jgi:ABC-2 type transport system permease protein
MSLDAATRRHDGATVPLHRQTLAFARRTVMEYARDRSALFWGLLMPVGWYVLFGLAIGSAPDSPAARASMAVAFGVFGAFTVTLVNFTTTLSADLTERRYRKLRSLPVSPLADYVGRFLGAVLVAVVSFCLVLAVGATTGATYILRSPGSIAVIALALVLFSLVGTAAAVLVATTVTEGEYVVAVSNVLLLGLFFVTGYNGLTPGLAPGPLSQYVNLAPNALSTRLAIYHLTDVPTNAASLAPPPLPSGPEYVALLAGYAFVLSTGAALLLGRRVYDADGGE